MNKKDIKNILMSMRTSKNDEIINKMLGRIDMMNELSLKNAIEQFGGQEEAIRTFFKDEIEKRQSDYTEQHTSINEMFSYGISDNCIHLHLPIDLHQMILEKGISKTMDIVNLQLLDAIDKIKSLRENGYYKFQEKDSVYMISPILLGRELKFLEELDFKIRMYKKKELNDAEFIKNNPEAILAIHIFGKERNIGTASIEFSTIVSKEWQERKEKVVKKITSKGIGMEIQNSSMEVRQMNSR